MRLGALAAVVAVLGAAWLLWDPDGSVTDRAAEERAAPPVPAPRARGAERPPAPPPQAGDEPPPVRPSGTSATPAPAPAADGRVVLRGLVVVEEPGGERGNESGTLDLEIESEDGYETLRVEVAGGAWRATVPADATLSFGDVLLGGRHAVPLEGEMAVPADGAVVLRCRWHAPTRLRVLDAATGVELDGVEIAQRTDTMFESEIHPGPEGRAKLVVEDASSPVALSGPAGTETYWVRARGHAWGRLRVSLGLGGERVVRLPAAGAVAIRLAPYDPKAGVALHIHRGGSHSLTWPAGRDGAAVIEALAPGRYEVRAAIGDWWRTPRVLARAAFEVKAGVRTEVRLDVAPVEAPALVPVAGTLHVDPAWPAESWIWISVRGVEVPPGTRDPRIERLEEGRWSAGKLPPGRYAFQVDPWMWTQVVDIGPRGNTSVRLVVPPPCDVEVRPVDRDSGEPLAVRDGLHWTMKRPGGGSLQSEAPAAPGLYRFRAPVGTLVVSLWGDRIRAPDTEFELQPGLNRLELRASHLCGIEIVLKDGVIIVPIDDEFGAGISIAALEGEGLPASWSRHTAEARTLGVTKPGRYRVSFLREIDGYRPIDPREVTVPAGETVRLVVKLERDDR